jgi:hypothetical protein
VQRYEELVGQPLLLLLLALYDRRAGLRHLTARTHAALYEAVLRDYVRREHWRTAPERHRADDAETVVDADLHRPSGGPRRPVVGVLAHRGRRGDRVERDDLAEGVRDPGGGLVAVDAPPSPIRAHEVPPSASGRWTLSVSPRPSHDRTDDDDT